MIINDTPPLRFVEAKRHSDWEDPPRRLDVFKAWNTDIETHVRSYALTAARQTIEGSSHDADETTIKVQRAKAQLAATLPAHEQAKHIRKHFNLAEDDIQSNQDKQEAAVKSLKELHKKQLRLTSLLHNLRDEVS